METKGNKVVPRIQKWEQERNKVGTKWGQESKSGNKKGTKWNKGGPRIPKWEQERNKVGTKWDQEPISGNKRETKRERSGTKNSKVGTRQGFFW